MPATVSSQSRFPSGEEIIAALKGPDALEVLRGMVGDLAAVADAQDIKPCGIPSKEIDPSSKDAPDKPDLANDANGDGLPDDAATEYRKLAEVLHFLLYETDMQAEDDPCVAREESIRGLSDLLRGTSSRGELIRIIGDICAHEGRGVLGVKPAITAIDDAPAIPWTVRVHGQDKKIGTDCSDSQAPSPGGPH